MANSKESNFLYCVFRDKLILISVIFTAVSKSTKMIKFFWFLNNSKQIGLPNKILSNFNKNLVFIHYVGNPVRKRNLLAIRMAKDWIRYSRGDIYKMKWQ
jgi:hypothetical protein